ncbi:MAG: mechanosensitive ion channel family protein, partial [Holophagales bacterium]|nr:mechanosensitive ion channel family protein [Holophagales bacterium]
MPIATFPISELLTNTACRLLRIFWAGPGLLPPASLAQENAPPASGGQESAPETAPIWLELKDRVPEPLVQLWEWTGTHPLISAGLLVVLAYGLAKAAEVAMRHGVGRLTAKTRTDVDDRLLELAKKPVFYTVFLIGLGAATLSLRLPSGISDFTLSALATIVVLSWLGASLPGLRLVLDALGRHHDRFPLIEERTIPLFDIISKVVLIGGASYAMLEIWQINPAPWFASAGVIGIAVGFAARDTLANLFAGIFIIADAPYKLGD